jgi:hypothetical protein
LPDLLSPANFDFFARYLLAGFILLSVRSWFVSAQRPKATEVLFDSVILSLINQLVFLLTAPAVGLALSALPQAVPGFVHAITDGRGAFFAEVLLLPALLGALFGTALATGRGSGLLRRLAMPNTHPTERAYDFAFAQRSGPCFVILTYKDGTEVRGFFGTNSLAASDVDRSDIYLERLYSTDATGQWLEVDPPRAALLALDGMRSIEFLSQEGDGDGAEASG